jgi:hypothetical protein
MKKQRGGRTVDEPGQATTRPGRRAPGGAASVLAVQRMAGNRATTQLLRKQKPGMTEKQKQVEIDRDAALKYIDDYYEGVRDVINLKEKCLAQAITDYQKFGELKDPPKLLDAVLGAIFNQIVGLIPGGKLITGAVQTSLFTLELIKLQKDLDEYPIPGVSVEDTKKQGPSEATKAKAGKIYERGKTAVDAGKAVVDAVKDTREKQEAASKAEAEAKENARLHKGRISQWTEAIANARKQEQEINDVVFKAARSGKGGGLEALVKKRLGPIPTVSTELQNKLSNEFELELYRNKITWVHHTTITKGGYYPGERESWWLELKGGGKPSGATLSRIAECLGKPWLIHLGGGSIAEALGLKPEHRTQTIDADKYRPRLSEKL